jgi:hypothetical protein
MRDSFWRPESSVMKCVVVVVFVGMGSEGSEGSEGLEGLEGLEGSERVGESCQGTRREA